ncbi:transposase, partial [Alteromonas sp. BZK5]|nr:transposase [Alteromonas sp. BZK5]
MFKQYGIELSRRTMADWMIKCSTLFKPLVERLKTIQLEQPVIQADETTLKVISEDKSTCYMWLYCTGSDSPNENPIPNIVLYDYQNNRSGRCAVEYLGYYSGYLQVDGYQGYEQTKATLAGFRVDEDITALTPHRPGRAQLTHPVLHNSLFAA